MTIRTKTYIAGQFQNGDVPSGTDFSDWVQSCITAAETSAQSMTGSLNVVTEINSALVSATTGTFTNLNAGTLNGSVSGATGNFTTQVTTPLVSGANGNFTTQVQTPLVSAAAGNFTTQVVTPLVTATTVNTSRLSVATRMQVAVATVSGTGTTQGTGTTLTVPYTVLTPTSADNAYVLPGGYAGDQRMVRNSVAVTAFVFPPTGGTINGGSTNAAYTVPGSARVTIVAESSAAFFTWRSLDT